MTMQADCLVKSINIVDGDDAKELLLCEGKEYLFTWQEIMEAREIHNL